MSDNSEGTAAEVLVGGDGVVRLDSEHRERDCYCRCWWAGVEHEHPRAFDQGRERPTVGAVERIARALWDQDHAAWLTFAAIEAERRHGAAWAAAVTAPAGHTTRARGLGGAA